MVPSRRVRAPGAETRAPAQLGLGRSLEGPPARRPPVPPRSHSGLWPQRKMELGWWMQLGLTFLQLLLIAPLPRGTVSSLQGPPGAGHLSSGVWWGVGLGSPKSWCWGWAVGLLLGTLLRARLVVLERLPPSLRMTWFCHPNLWD